MTAIVGIMNKQAIAVAADSAVTIGGGVKVYNTANKIFNLAKGCSVGIAVYGNASLNGCIPWEVVIKMYRSRIGTTRFPKLDGFVNDFFNYVREYSKEYISDEDALNVLKSNIMQFWCEYFTRGLRESEEFDAPISKQAYPILKTKLNSLSAQLKKQKVHNDYKNIKIDDFVSAISDVLTLLQKQITKNGGKWEDFSTSIQEILYKLFTTNDIGNPNISGVSIFGYGEDEIYPSLQEYLVHSIVLGVQRIEQMPSINISEKMEASIRPMAQRDVIETFIEGVSHKIKETFIEATALAIKDAVKGVSNIIRPQNESLADKIKLMDCTPIIKRYNEAIDGIIKKDHVSPLIRTIATMGKEDIADLAENLIYMTSMKRHVSPFAETVGGPIDVAVISKGDGFIWMKRKHYFSADLNRHFFDNKH